MSTPGQHRSQFPIAFEKVLLRYLKQTYLKKGKGQSQWNHRDSEYFARGIVALNKNFTANRAGKYRDYFRDPMMRSGYLSYFLPVNAMKIYGILQKHDRHINFPKEIRVADIGAGPLTMSVGLLFHIADHLQEIPGKVSIIIDAYELNQKILLDGMRLIKDYLKQSGLHQNILLKINGMNGNIFKQNIKDIEYDYILLGNFLNEFEKREQQEDIVRKLLNKFSKDQSKVLFLEPGSKKFTRDLQCLRDKLIDDTSFVVLGPCLHQHGCPLNITAKSDWCNFTGQWQAPEFIKSFDDITKLKKEYLLYSYLFMQNTSQFKQASQQEFVAITDKMKAKGRFEVVGCGPAGRIRFIRSHRDVSNSNQDFDRLSRGKYFTIPTFKGTETFEINKNVSLKPNDKVEI